MPRNPALIIASVALVASFLYFRPLLLPATDPLLPIKNKSTTSFKHKHIISVADNLKMTKKLESPMQIEIEHIDQSAIEINKVFTLKAQLTSNKNINSVNIQWRLPANVEHIGGHKEHSLAKVLALKPENFEITLKATSNVDNSVFFVVTTNAGAQQVTRSEQYLLFSQAQSNKELIDTSKRAIEYNEKGKQNKVFK